MSYCFGVGEPYRLIAYFPTYIFFFSFLKKRVFSCSSNGFQLYNLTIFLSPCSYVSPLPFFWKHCGKRRKLLVTSNFSSSHSVFYPFRKLSVVYMKIKIVVCKPFPFGRIQKSESVKKEYSISNVSSKQLRFYVFHEIRRSTTKKRTLWKYCEKRRKSCLPFTP